MAASQGGEILSVARTILPKNSEDATRHFGAPDFLCEADCPRCFFPLICKDDDDFLCSTMICGVCRRTLAGGVWARGFMYRTNDELSHSDIEAFEGYAVKRLPRGRSKGYLGGRFGLENGDVLHCKNCNYLVCPWCVCKAIKNWAAYGYVW